jgi:antibiotic biosynthesis monooxygenase (ABM) superfamily enzyme
VVSEFAGYLGNDVAGSPDADEWTVIYRFESKPSLESWLASPEQDEILNRGADYFDGPASQHVLVRDQDADLITIVVAHPVDPADEEAFLAWQERVTDTERQFAGFRGAELFRPVPGVQDEWTALYRFDTEEHVNGWLESAERQKLLDEGRRFKDFKLHRISSPFGSWFAPPGENEDGEGPAQWKTALSVLVGLYPTVVLLTLGITAIWKNAELWLSLLVGNILFGQPPDLGGDAGRHPRPAVLAGTRGQPGQPPPERARHPGIGSVPDLRGVRVLALHHPGLAPALGVPRGYLAASSIWTG